MNIYELISRAQGLRQETKLDSVSPDRVGALCEDTLKYINEFQLLASSPSLHKIYVSVSAMQADAAPKSDLTGKALKPGQLVVIVPANQSDATAGDVYRYDGPSGNTSAWTFISKIGAVPADAELSATSENPVQNKVVTEKLTELSAEVSKKADTDGKYAELVSGDLYGHGESVETEFSFRASGGKSIKDGTAYVKEVHGNAVVWNQCFGNGTTNSDYLNWDGNVATINGEFEADNTSYDTTSSGARFVAPIIGHKYLVEIDIISGTISGRLQNYLVCAAKTIDLYEDKLSAKEFITPTTTSSYWIARTMIANTIATNLKVRHRITDLTQMFGAGNEPTTIEEFYARLPKGIDLYAYNEGEVVNMNVEGIKSVGFNAWDEEWELGAFDTTTGANYNYLEQWRTKNPIPILPNEKYSVSITKSGIWCLFLDGNFQAIPNGLDSIYNVSGNSFNIHSLYGVRYFYTPENAKYIKFYAETSYGTTYNNDICIHLVHTGYRNGEYEPYVSDEIALPISEYFPSGMKSIGNVRDEITATQAIQRIGVVDMGTLQWVADTRFNNPQYYTVSSNIKNSGGVLCEKYNTIKGSWDTNIDKTIFTASTQIVIIVDSSYTDAASFKAAMAGVLLYYELAEPIVTTLDKPLNLDYQVWDFGTEEAIAEGKTTPLKASIIYEFNARDTIRANKLALKTKADKAYVDEAIAQAITNTLNTPV